MRFDWELIKSQIKIIKKTHLNEDMKVSHTSLPVEDDPEIKSA